MSEASREIKIIAGPPAVAATVGPGESLPREGPQVLIPEEHFKISFFTKKPVEHLANQIVDLKDKIATVVTSLSQCVVEKTELEDVKIGLAVSLEGDVGIASAGAEVSIELTYRIKK